MVSFTGPANTPAAVRVWEVFEISMQSKTSYENPYAAGFPDDGQSLVRVTFTAESGVMAGKKIVVSGFWDGCDTWKARFAPPAAGDWSYASASTDPGLDRKTGTLTVTEWTAGERKENPTRNGFIRVCKTGNRAGRYFEYADGTPFFWLGDTWWNWTKRGIPLHRFQTLVEDRARKGFTVGQLFVAGNGWGRSSSLLDETYSILDVNHMQKVDSMVTYANAKGMTVWVHAWWARENMNERVGPEKMRRWWRYLVHRLGAYNVLWVVAGEYNMYNYGGLGLDFWKDLGKMIKSEDPYERIVSAHTTPPTYGGGFGAPQWSTGDVLHGEAWLDYNQIQTGHGQWKGERTPFIVARDYSRIPAKPTVVTEPWYEFVIDTASAAYVRYAGWTSVLSGAPGHSYGGGHVWKAHVPEAPAGRDNWPMEMGFGTNTLDYPGAMGMSYMARFFRGLRWWELEPHNDVVSGAADLFCAAVPGEEYVVYSRFGGTIHIDLKPASSNDTFRYEWYNPRAGTYSKNEEILTGPTATLTTPDMQDWVLHVYGQEREKE